MAEGRWPRGARQRCARSPGTPLDFRAGTRGSRRAFQSPRTCGEKRPRGPPPGRLRDARSTLPVASLGLDALEHIKAAPDDDAPRLVYADQLTERGDARGELITVQCALARGGQPRDERIALRRRERGLLERHGKGWAALAGLATKWTFRRGFVDEARVDARLAVARAPELVAKAPLLRRLTLDGLSSGPDDTEPPHPGAAALFKAVLDAPALAQVTHLDLGDPIASYWYEGEFSTYQRGDRLADQLIAQLVRSGSLRRLRGLRVEGVMAAGLRTLAESPDAAALEALELFGWFGREGREALGAAGAHLRPRLLCLGTRR